MNRDCDQPDAPHCSNLPSHHSNETSPPTVSNFTAPKEHGASSCVHRNPGKPFMTWQGNRFSNPRERSWQKGRIHWHLRPGPSCWPSQVIRGSGSWSFAFNASLCRATAKWMMPPWHQSSCHRYLGSCWGATGPTASAVPVSPWSDMLFPLHLQANPKTPCSLKCLKWQRKTTVDIWINRCCTPVR